MTTSAYSKPITTDMMGHSNNSRGSSNQHPAASETQESANEAWREFGKLYRAQLVLEDEEKGGNTFMLSNDCSIDRYYAVAEKVLDQFLSAGIGDAAELSDSYLVGNRLVKFLSAVLPTHTDYFSTDPRLAASRDRSQAQLVELLQYMEELALLIDKIEYESYILQDLTMDAEDKTIFSGLSASIDEDGAAAVPNAYDSGTMASTMKRQNGVGSNGARGVTYSARSQSQSHPQPRGGGNSEKVAPEQDPFLAPQIKHGSKKSTFGQMPSASTTSNIDLLLDHSDSDVYDGIDHADQEGLPELSTATSSSSNSSASPRSAVPAATTTSTALFDDDPHAWNAFEDDDDPFTSKIERRWDAASNFNNNNYKMTTKITTADQFDTWHDRSLDDSIVESILTDRSKTDDDHHLASSSSRRKNRLLGQFKGCVRCLLD